jgi:gluconate kinase
MAITIVSGVSGSGKSTVAQVLLRHIGQQGSFIDADDFWTGTAAKQKMQEGQPLTDEDR